MIRKMTLISAILLLLFTPNLTGQDSPNDLLLETIGVLSAQGIYLTYSSIGTTADNYVSGSYDADFAGQIMGEYISLTEVARDQLSTVMSSGILSSEDISYVDQLVTGYNLLISEAKAFSNYIKTGDEGFIDVFENNRVAAWNLISELLGLE